MKQGNSSEDRSAFRRFSRSLSRIVGPAASASAGKNETCTGEDLRFSGFRISPIDDTSLTGTPQSLPAPAIAGGESSSKNPTSPFSPRKSASASPIHEIAQPSILVIDDNSLDTELIADMLGADYELLFATEGLAALEMASDTLPDLILLDVMMPGIDGYEVYSRLKADSRTSEIPVIFITGLDDVADETRGLKLGAVDYITKPIKPEPVKARVSTQIKLKLARDKFAQLAATDGLTGLANRSYFDAMLAYEYARHARSGAELSLILLDIDYFKAFNDTYGHVCGDECLRAIALAIKGATTRATDIVARFGGEEFVLLLPETHLQGAVLLAEKVRKCINDLAVPHLYSRTRHISASLGVACSRQLPGTLRLDIVEEADSQLYIAKSLGRNRVAYQVIEEPSSRQ